jgi:3-phenylpropionate/trans-cinnamate dioxygenase ferredoxin component
VADSPEYLEVMPADQLVEGAMVAKDDPFGRHKLLVARVDGEFYITQEHCQHMGGNLAKGKLNGSVVTCPLHHSRYDLRDGHVVRWTDWKGPVESMNIAVRHPRSLAAYEVKMEDGKVLVGPQKPEAPVSPEVMAGGSAPAE